MKDEKMSVYASPKRGRKKTKFFRYSSLVPSVGVSAVGQRKGNLYFILQPSVDCQLGLD
jgi:hypothetical protein